jgi:hypothetical protein
MDNDRLFDNIARSVAAAQSRRSLLGRLVAAGAGGLATTMLPGRAAAACQSNQVPCGPQRICCGGNGFVCCGGKANPSRGTCCQTGQCTNPDSGICCPGGGAPCGVICRAANQICCTDDPKPANGPYLCMRNQACNGGQCRALGSPGGGGGGGGGSCPPTCEADPTSLGGSGCPPGCKLSSNPQCPPGCVADSTSSWGCTCTTGGGGGTGCPPGCNCSSGRPQCGGFLPLPGPRHRRRHRAERHRRGTDGKTGGHAGRD